MTSLTPPAQTRYLGAGIGLFLATVGGFHLVRQAAPAPLGVTAGSPAPAASAVPAAATLLPAPNGEPAEVTTTPLDVGEKAEKSLGPAEREQLHLALDSARREVIRLSESDAALPANEGVIYFAQNPAGRVHADFLGDRVRFETGEGSETAAALRFTGSSGDSTVEASGSHRVTYRHGQGISEWFENGPHGIEHGFTFESRPQGQGAGEILRVDLDLEGATAIPGESADQLHFLNESGKAILSYTSLKAWDAQGTELPATMAAVDGDIRLQVDDRSAVYPVTIDPLVTAFQQKLLPEITGEGHPQDLFGNTEIAVDGDTALIAAYGSGCAWVFTRSAGVWSIQTKLGFPTGLGYGGSLGHAIALDGNTALVSANNGGRIFVFTRSGTTWSFQAELRSANMTWWNFGDFGYDLAIDGDRALIGIPGDQNNRGAACFFTRSGTTWTEGQALYAPDGASGDYFGYSVALDGDTALIGAPGDSGPTVSQCGSARVWVHNGSTWAEQAALRLQVAVTGDSLGQSVALEGDTALVGAPGGDNLGGSANVFTRSGTLWTQRAKLTIGANVIRFGWAVGLSGNTAVCSGFWYRPENLAPFPYTGSAAVFTGSGSSWSLQQRLGSDSGTTEKGFGVSAAVDGDTVLVGAYWDQDLVNGRFDSKVHSFVRSAAVWSPQGYLDAGDSKFGTQFGSALALEGDVAVIGMSAETTPRGFQAGAAYVMVRNAGVWSRVALLSASEGKLLDRFGAAAAIDGDTILIGASFAEVPEPPKLDYLRPGRAYVFKKLAGVWTEQARIEHPEPKHHEFFGASLDLDGDTAVIGAWWNGDTMLSGAGCAYVFTRSGDTWTLETKLVSAVRQPNGQFGESIALDGDHLVIGAVGTEKAEVFRRGGGVWQRQPSFTAAQAPSFKSYGSEVALDGNTALVSGVYATADGAAASKVVEVFAFAAGAWTRQAVLEPNDPNLDANFGNALAIQGDTAVISANTADYKGAVYIFKRQGAIWIQHSKLITPDAVGLQHFGDRVAIDGDTVIASASERTGSAYVFLIGASQADLAVTDDDHASVGEGETYDFGVELTTSAVGWGDYFLLLNPGYADLTGITVVSSAPEDFSILSLTKTTVAPGSSSQLQIDFHPTVSGPRSAVITISSPDRVPYSFTVTGTGNQPPVITSAVLQGAYQQPLVIDIKDLITDADDPGVERGLSSGTSINGGIITQDGDLLTYVPKSTWSGPDHIYLRADDHRGGSASGHVVIDVVGPHWIGEMTAFSKVAAPGGPATITFRSTPWRGWIFERSTDLRNWSEVGRNNTYNFSTITFTDPSPPVGKAYYRLRDPF